MNRSADLRHPERLAGGTQPDESHEVGGRARRVMLLAASLALAAILIGIGRAGDGSAFLRAAVINLAVVAWSSFVLPLRGLPAFESYYRLRRWERSGRPYRALGVHLFRALVRRGPLATFNHALPAAWRSGDPERIEHEIRAAEAGHGIAFAIVLAYAIVACLRRDVAGAVWLLALDVPMNLYPVLLQRYHRARRAGAA
jgi:hypothetical protein